MTNGIPDGQGVYYDRNGQVLYCGYWVDGEFHIQGSDWFCYQSESIKKRRIRNMIDVSAQNWKVFTRSLKKKWKGFMEWVKNNCLNIFKIIVILFVLHPFIILFVSLYIYGMMTRLLKMFHLTISCDLIIACLPKIFKSNKQQ